MKDDNNIFGCFMSIGFDPNLTEHEFADIAKFVKPYIWGDKGICNKLKKLKHANYGKDLILALFQFYVKPTQIELQKLKEIESYRKKEKAIGIPIILNDENFFLQSKEDRYSFLIQSIFQKFDLLKEIIVKKKLDTNIDLLKADLKKVLDK